MRSGIIVFTLGEGDFKEVEGLMKDVMGVLKGITPFEVYLNNVGYSK